MKRFNVYLILILATILCFGSVFQTGCSGFTGKYSGPNINGYRVFSMNEGIASFSFTYPADWNVEWVKLNADYTSVWINAPRFEERGKDIFSSGFSIDITKASNTYPNSMALLEHRINTDANRTGYKLIDRNTSKLGNIETEQVKFSYLAPTSNQGPSTEPFIAQAFYFDYSGFIWHLDTLSHEKVISIDQSSLDHILSTFKLLD
jgi:hypothetical protein